jgi:hypothetical protein
MSYTLGQAAKATGTSKPTLSRAIKSGRLSAQKQPDGSFVIDPSELHRVYPPATTTGNDNDNDNGNAEQSETPNNHKALQEQLETLREERDRERRQLQATIDDLRDERGRLLKVLEEQAGTVKQLTYQPQTTPPDPTEAHQPRQWPTPATYWLAAIVAVLAVLWAVVVWTHQL